MASWLINCSTSLSVKLAPLRSLILFELAVALAEIPSDSMTLGLSLPNTFLTLLSILRRMSSAVMRSFILPLVSMSGWASMMDENRLARSSGVVFPSLSFVVGVPYMLDECLKNSGVPHELIISTPASIS